MNQVSIIQTGTANTASVVAACRRLGLSVDIAASPEKIAADAGVILPGVGAFAVAREELRVSGFDQYLTDRILAGHPTLAICLGLQLLCQSSEEDPGVEGLGILPTSTTKIPISPGSENTNLPHLGWNQVRAEESCTIIQTGYAYYANSFCVPDPPAGWQTATTEFGSTKFVAGIERGAVVACQFHPELSGTFGAAIIRRWCQVAQEEKLSC